MSALRPRLLRFQVGTLLVAAVALTTGLFAAGAADADDWVTLADADALKSDGVLFLSQNDLEELGVVSSRQFAVYLVRGPEGLVALNAYGGYRRERVTYCPSSELFETARSGSKFDKYGHYFSGPAPVGLARLPVRAVDGLVQVQPYERLPRLTRKDSKGLSMRPAGRYCIPY